MFLHIYVDKMTLLIYVLCSSKYDCTTIIDWIILWLWWILHEIMIYIMFYLKSMWCWDLQEIDPNGEFMLMHKIKLIYDIIFISHS